MYRILVADSEREAATITSNKEKKSVDFTDKTQAHQVIANMLDHLALKVSRESPNTYSATMQEMSRITPSQRAIIQETFLVLERDTIRNGLSILVMLFAEYPQYKSIWPQFRSIPDSSLMNAIELRRHASVYMCGLRTIIDAMDDDEKLIDEVTRIARAHIKWSIHKKHLMHMVRPVLDLIRVQTGSLNQETTEAWITLYDVIANLIDIYREKEMRKQKENQNLTAEYH